MTRQQSTILWIGLFLVVVYLFTDTSVRDVVFNRNQKNPTVTSSFTVLTPAASSTGNGQSNSGNSPTVPGTVTL